MICEIISVGTELLLGEIANTDAQYISKGLAELGIFCYYHSVCGDNPARLNETLRIARGRADIIITTGGLGPTADDLTKETIAAAFGRKLYTDEAQLERLKIRMSGRPMTSNNLKQADLPEGCTVLENDWGTAPGCAIEWEEGKHLIMLPGPPSECRPMFDHRARPYLMALSDSVIYSTYIRIYGMGESAVEDKLSFLMNSLENPTAAPYAKDGECEVRVTARAKTEEEAKAMCAPVVEQIREILGDVIYGIDVGSIEEALSMVMKEKKLTVATAESCTAGLVAKRITDIAGASEYFNMGVVTYSNEAKMKLLGVSEETLKAHGAVSPETAAEMARGIRLLSGADIGISVTGIAGPGGGTPEKPVGLYYAGVSTAEGEEVISRSFRTTRQRIRHSAASAAIDLARRAAEKL